MAGGAGVGFGPGGGTAFDTKVQRDASGNVQVTAKSGQAIVLNNTGQLPGVAFASCFGVTNAATGACNQKGAFCQINDDNTACSFSATIVNGGTHPVFGICDGTEYQMATCK
jgi:hypothetical protein